MTALSSTNMNPQTSPYSAVSLGSKESVNTSNSVRSHQEYLDSLIPPTKEEIKRISGLQEAKEKEIMEKRKSLESCGLSDEERANAAAMIQRSYRGYRERRQVLGMGLDPSSRWIEAFREARYRNLTMPRARANHEGERTVTDTDGTREHLEADEQRQFAREEWRKVRLIVKRAARDEDSDIESDEDDDLPDDEREERRRKRIEQTRQRQKDAKMLDLQYFLEMVDLKHRYGTNLKAYHLEWKRSATQENFFYWLDEGEGRFIDVQGCPRERLDREKVRYLSREERLNYLVKIDKEGRLCWAKNGARIDTTEKYKDSIHGIVPAIDPTPSYAEFEAEVVTSPQSHESGDEDTSGSSTLERDSSHESTGLAYTTELDRTKGMKKVKHVSAATIFDRLLRSSVKKNTWIFVADTNFRLYVGIKKSGNFQHSSFLHGSRITAAGLLTIKDGLLGKLSPLSGHYRPTTSSFRAFMHSLKDAGVDMSHVSISRSYAVLLGLETYLKTRRKGKKLLKSLMHGRDKLLSHDAVDQHEDETLDRKKNDVMERSLHETQYEENPSEENEVNVDLLKELYIRPETQV